MKELNELLEEIKLLHGDSIRIRHTLNPDGTDISLVNEAGQAVIVINGRLPDEYYIRIPDALYSSGIVSISLDAHAIWISAMTAPPGVVISDHIACHHTNPLTGTVEARYGEAFIDMRDPYNLDGVDSVDAVVLWHTALEGRLSAEEMSAARAAGCSVASPVIAPWAVGARKAGCTLSAAVTLT
jgi:hypothetical protein